MAMPMIVLLGRGSELEPDPVPEPVPLVALGPDDPALVAVFVVGDDWETLKTIQVSLYRF